jgi:YihY family inner membrane protein
MPQPEPPPLTPVTTNPVARFVRRIDRAQQKSAPLGFVVGVVKKYGDDKGGQLANRMAFAGFLSFFPLMLIVVTVTAFLSERSPSLAERIRTSAIGEFPVVGAELAKNAGQLPGSGLGLTIGFVGLLLGGFGFTHAMQDAFLEVWNVPYKVRPGFAYRLAHGIGVIALFASATVASVVLALLGALIKNSRLVGAFGQFGALAISASLFFSLFWLLSPRNVRIADLLPGAALAAFGWQALQFAGIRLVGHQLRRSSELYGTIGAALGLIWFLALFTQILVYALEITVVRKGRLWPRSILQPPLTGPDIAVMSALAMQQERRPEEKVTVHFESSHVDTT